jgi:membrane-bound lytic murein transglycosylase F
VHAEQLKEARKSHPDLQWKEVEAKDADELLARVAEGVIDMTLGHSHLAAVAQNFHPELEIGFNLGQSQKLAWAFPVRGDILLVKKAEAFFARLEKEGTLKRVMERYYGHVERLERADVVGFLAKMNTRLPNYRAYFQQAQDLTGIDWRLLAAVAYQESHWDPLATSPTGVRGMMMLTEDTADRLGVKNRLDPRESILAGSRYLLNLKDMLSERIAEPDRTWIALAAYNTGYGHVEDARVLAQRLKMNADAWVDLKKALPQLAKPSVHATLKHGFARGGEAVIMAENIRTYYDVLVRYQPPYRSAIPVLGQ